MCAGVLPSGGRPFLHNVGHRGREVAADKDGLRVGQGEGLEQAGLGPQLEVERLCGARGTVILSTSMFAQATPEIASAWPYLSTAGLPDQ